MTIKIETGSLNTSLPTVLYENIFTVFNITATSEATNGLAINCVGDQTFDFWTGTAVTDRISLDATTPTEVDCLGISNHDLFTQGADIVLESSTDDISWTSRGSLTPVDDSDIFLIIPTVTARYWRVSVTNGPASLGVVKLGKRLVFTAGLLHGYTPTNFSDDIKVIDGVTIGGNFTGSTIVSLGGKASFALGGMTRDFIEGEMLPFINHFNRSKSFFWAGGPDYLSLDTAYCWRPRNGSTLKPKYVGGNIVEVTRINVRVFK